MIRKNFYTSLSLPIFVLASACATTGQSTDQFSDRESSASKSQVTKPMRNGLVTDQPSAQNSPWPSNASQAPMKLATGMPIGGPEVAPKGLYDLCIRNPDTCVMGSARTERAGAPARLEQARQYRDSRPSRNQSGFVLTSYSDSNDLGDRVPSTPLPAVSPIRPISWTSGNRQIVSRINRQINNAMVGVTDLVAFGREELWTLPITEPDRPRGKEKPLGDCEDFALEKRKALIEAGIPQDALYLAVAVSAVTGLHAVLVIATDEGDFVLDNMSEWLVEWNKTSYVWIQRQASTSLLDWKNTRATQAKPSVMPPSEHDFFRQSPVIVARLEANAPSVPAALAETPPDMAPIRVADGNTQSRREGVGPQILRGSRGLAFDIEPQFVPASLSTSSVAGIETLGLAPLEDYALNPISGPKMRPRADVARSEPRLVSLDRAFASLANFPIAPKAGVAVSDPVGSPPAPFKLSLTRDLQTLPEQTFWYLGIDGYFAALSPQKMPSFAGGALTFANLPEDDWGRLTDRFLLAALD